MRITVSMIVMECRIFFIRIILQNRWTMKLQSEITLEQLEKDFPKEVTEALKLLTHSDDTDYFEYVRAIKSNPIAKAVKMADLLHNSDQSRITDKNVVSDEKIEYWNNKYTKARQILEE